jgi:hypothetical protein
MIKFYLITVFFFSVFSAYSLPEDSTLISRHRPGIFWYFNGLKPAKSSKIRKYDRLIFDAAFNSWTGDQAAFSNRWNSIGLTTNLLFDIPLDANNQFSIGTGISHSWFNVAFDPNFKFYTYSNQTFLGNAPSTEHFNEQHLSGHSLSIPLEIRFRTKGWKHFKVHIGGKIGYQLTIYATSVRNEENGQYIEKNYNFGDINRLIYSVHMRIGIRNWGLFANYQLNPLFAHSSSVKLNVFQLGLSLSLF